MCLLPWYHTEERQRADGKKTEGRQLRPKTHLLPAFLSLLLQNYSTAAEEFSKKRPFSRTFPEEFPNKWVVFPNESRSTLQEMGYFSRRIPEGWLRKSGRNAKGELVVPWTFPGVVCHLSWSCLTSVSEVSGSYVGGTWFEIWGARNDGFPKSGFPI